MAKTLQSSGAIGISGGSTTYEFVANTYTIGSSSESPAQITYRLAGIISNLSVRVRSNTIAATSTVTLRKNGSDGNNTISITSLATGEFEDTTHTDIVSAGDAICVKCVGGGVAGSLICSIATLFSSDTNTSIHFNCTTSSSFYADPSTSYYIPIAGDEINSNTNEAPVKLSVAGGGYLKHLFTRMFYNSNDNAVTIKTRVNGADGNLSVSIPASTTGVFEDITNTDVLLDGYDINYVIATGAGAVDFAPYAISCEFVSTDGSFYSVTGDDIGTTYGTSTQYFYIGSGSMDSQPLETNIKQDINIACTASNLFLNVNANNRSTSTTFDLRVNGVSSALTISVPANTAGQFEDTTHTVSLVPTDEVNFRLSVPAGTGTIQPYIMAVKFKSSVNNNFLLVF